MSRRLSLVRTLPAPIQQHVRNGQLVAHAAVKYFVPLARANACDCVRLVEAITPHRLSTRQIGRLYQVYVTGPDATRELVLTDPLLVLRVAADTADASVRPEASAPETLITDLHILGAAGRTLQQAPHGPRLGRAAPWTAEAVGPPQPLEIRATGVLSPELRIEFGVISRVLRHRSEQYMLGHLSQVDNQLGES